MSTATTLEAASRPVGVDAELQFLVPGADKPRTYTFDPPGGGPAPP